MNGKVKYKFITHKMDYCIIGNINAKNEISTSTVGMEIAILIKQIK